MIIDDNKTFSKELHETLIPIIAMSGYFPIENQAVLLDMSNMDARVEKPFTISDLIAQIESLLGEEENLAVTSSSC